MKKLSKKHALKRGMALLMLCALVFSNAAMGVHADENEPKTEEPAVTEAPVNQSEPVVGEGQGTGTTVGEGEGQGTGTTVGEGEGQGTGATVGEGEGQGTGTTVGEGEGQGTGATVGEGEGQGTGTTTGEGEGEGQGTGTAVGEGEGQGAGTTGEGEGEGEEPLFCCLHWGDIEYVKSESGNYHEVLCADCHEPISEAEPCNSNKVTYDSESHKEIYSCDKCGRKMSSVDQSVSVGEIQYTGSEPRQVDEENEDQLVFVAPVTLEVSVSCDSRVIGDVSVELTCDDLVNGGTATFGPSCRTGSDGNYKFSFDFDGDNVDYKNFKVTVTNRKHSDNTAETENTDWEIKLFQLNNNINYTYVTAVDADGNTLWQYTDKDEYTDNWYSKLSNKNVDKFLITTSGQTLFGIYNVKLTDNGENIEGIKEIKAESKPCDEPWLCCIYQNTYIYEVPATDGNHNYEFSYDYFLSTFSNTVEVNVDNIAPEVNSITYNGNSTPVGSTNADKGFFNENVEVQVKVTEKNLTDTNQLAGVYVKSESGDSIPLTYKEKDGDVYIFAATVSGNGTYKLEGTIVDKAKNSTDLAAQESFTIDKDAPTINVEFDNNEVRNNKYYKAARVATITITDANFDADDKYLTLTISNKDGEATVGGWEKANETTFIKRITFDKDGVYSFTASCKDKAGNTASAEPVAEFVIDTTAPVINVSFDNNSALNDNYFKSARQATITITDVSFDAGLVTVEKTSEDALNALPGLNGYTESGNEHTATMKFENDGKFAFQVTCQDLAGNTADTYTSGVFFIDTTAPEVTITGVTDMSANNGKVEPVISTTDENLKVEDVVVTLTGANNGQVKTGSTTTEVKGGFTVQFADLDYVKANDDLYILKASITDMAGNVTEKEIKYSVNRFGSVYVLGDGTLSMINNYYVTNPQNVVITEINVDELTYKEVSLTYDGSVKELSAGSGYTTSETVNNNGWHSISYTVDKSNFRNDGLYSVAVYSQDKATNTQSNQSKDAEIEFLVDSTAPSVIVAGIESDGVYQEPEHDFSVNVTDTIGVAGLTVYLNDKVIGEYTASELQENGGTEILTIPAKDDYQKVVIVCSDVAGNETKLSCNNILVSEKAEELIEKEIIQKAKVEPDEVTEGFFTSLPKAAAATCVVVIAIALVGVGVVGVRKIKK